MTFLQARWFTATTGRQIDVLVLHSMEYPEKPDSAEAVAQVFHTSDRKASAHACVDVNSRVDCVLDKDVAYAAPGSNHNGLHLEHAGYARQSRSEWLDAYSRPMIEGPAADWIAEKSQRYAVPLRFLTARDLQARARGVTTHNEVRLAFGQTTHTDPGGGYPIDVLLAAARDKLGGSVPPAQDPKELTMADRYCVPSWATRRADARAPFYRLDVKPPEAGKGNWCLVLAFNGAPLLRTDGSIFGVIPFTELHQLAAPPEAIAEIESTGAVVVLAGDGGVFDVARRP